MAPKSHGESSKGNREMAQATITLSGEGVQDVQELNVQIFVEASVETSAKASRRRVTIWLASEVGNMLMAGTPELVISEKNSLAAAGVDDLIRKKESLVRWDAWMLMHLLENH